MVSLLKKYGDVAKFQEAVMNCYVKKENRKHRSTIFPSHPLRF